MNPYFYNNRSVSANCLEAGGTFFLSGDGYYSVRKWSVKSQPTNEKLMNMGENGSDLIHRQLLQK